MKKIIFLLAFCNQVGYAQDLSVDTSSLRWTKASAQLLFEHSRVKTVNFQQSSILGNFATFDSKEAALQILGNKIFANGNSAGARLTTGIDDGYQGLFRNTQYNYRLGAELQLNVFAKNTFYLEEAPTDSTKSLRAGMEWVSFEYRIDSRSVRTYDSTKTAAEAFQRTSSTANRFMLRYNMLRLSSRGRTHFLNLGIGLLFDDNLELLQRRSVTTYDHDATIDTSSLTPQRFHVVDGLLSPREIMFALSVNYVIQPFRSSTNAFRFSFDVKSTPFFGNFGALGVGYIMNFQRGWNLELYGRVTTVKTDQATEVKFYDNLGFRVSLPLRYYSIKSSNK